MAIQKRLKHTLVLSSIAFSPSAPHKRELKDGEQFLPIMLTIRGESDIPEIELDHLEGYQGSKPVRIGNAANYIPYAT